ncbi:MAG: polysaccharide biosynthesis tyrosine autokinase [Deltaproteobacteria bacterium]|nr:polysaccharide biosynthesis tyrosine autokinase [Deltaproteobacteria bacterium]
MSDYDQVEKSKSLQLPGPDRSLPEAYPYPGYYSGYGDEELEQGWHLLDFWYVLEKRKWWFLGVFVPVVLAMGLYSFLTTPIYRASAILQIVQDNPSAIVSEKDPLDALSAGDTQGRFYETQYMLLGSKTLAAKIIQSLNLKEHPEYKELAKKNKDKTPYEIEAAYLEDFLKKLEILPLKKSYLVEIFFQSPDKDLAVKVPNAAYKEYLEFAMQTRQQSYSLIREWLENELHQLADKVEASEKKLYAHGKEKNFLALEGEDNVIVKKYVELNKVLTTAQTERAAKEAQYQQVQKRGADAPLIINNPLVQRLREEMITQKAQVASLAKTFGKNYPQLQAEQAKLGELKSRVNSEVQRTLASIKADYEAALRTENFLREEAGRQRKEVEGLQENLVQHNILKRDLQTNEQLYQALLARMKEASVASTMVASNAAVIQPAKPPLEPYKPKKALNMALAVLVGLMGGVGMAFLAEYLDSSIKTSEEMERVYRLPSLGVVPLLSTNSDRATSNGDRQLALATYAKPMSMLAEAVFHLRTSLMLSMSGRPPGTILVTSPNPGEGKTTLSINLASAMLFGDNKVLIIDGDLRRPHINQMFEVLLEPGLSNYLTGSTQITEIIKETPVQNLYIIPAGPKPPHPIQLLSSPAFRSLLEELKQDFAHIVIDTPPIIGFADARVVAHMVDGVLLVIRHNQTSRDAGKLAIQLLNQAYGNILGVVLNMAQKDKMGYRGYYSYYKYYHKYYDGYSKDSGKRA